HGSAWATLVCYFTLALLSYLFGQRYYKIPYEPGRIGVMILAALGVFFISTYTSAIDGAWMYVVHIILLGLFGALVLLIEPSLRSVFPRRS
ncbi:MAG: hypothetical protein ACLFS0_03390, partial [Bacteroidales bacterium]